MAARFAPKPTVLSGEPTLTQLEGWINNLVFNLTIDGSFDEFLAEDFRWSPPSVVNRGLVDDEGRGENKRTARQKAAYLNLMLGSIHSYAPVISKRFITEEATSLNEIWGRLRTRFGCRKTGSSILELTSLSASPDETHEALWERVLSFVEGNLISANDNIEHLGAKIETSEVMTPTLMNICIVMWLRIIHPGLPSLVKQKYATDLRNKTLASIRDEISESISSLLCEISGSEEHAGVSRLYKPYGTGYDKKNKFKRGKSKNNSKSCIICLTAKRPANHFLSECPFLPDEDRRYMNPKSKTRIIDATDDDDEGENSDSEEDESSNNRRVDIEASPEIHVLCDDIPVRAVLDSGADSNLIAERCAKRLNATILQTRATARQADGMSKLKIIGEVHTVFHRYPHKFKFNGLVVKDLKDDVVAGIPFLTLNDIFVRPAKRTIHIGDREVIKYDPARSLVSSSNRNVSVILRVPRQTVLLPGDTLSIPTPSTLKGLEHLAIEPRMISPSFHQDKSHKWLHPQIVLPSEDHITVKNEADHPILLRKHEQVANARLVEISELTISASDSNPDRATKPYSTVNTTSEPDNSQGHICHIQSTTVPLSSDRKIEMKPPKTVSEAYKFIEIDPSKKEPIVKRKFEQLHFQHKEVFDDSRLGLYNGYSGNLEVKVNMGPMLPRQRKGRMPLYNKKMQDEYQEICDSLEGTVLVKPEDVGVCVEYLNPSFLIRKPSGKKRLVTAFGEVGKYAKPQPALMPDSNQILRSIANWKFLVKTDLTSAYWQMPLATDSMKYCGIVTPYKGIRVYARGAMGMPGTETALEEMLSRILGSLISEGVVVKLADDLMMGGPTAEEVFNTWSKVLEAMNNNGLKLSASKTICLPQSVMILGWIWSDGKLTASPHRLSALQAIEPPSTVGKLRSYIGSYKFLSKVTPSYSDILSPLEAIVAGRMPNEKITWSDSGLNSFKRSQKQLDNSKTITLPRYSDNMQIVTDASKTGIAATLYVIRSNKPRVAGFFNAKLRKHQESWLPCELEALCIGSAVKHFGPDIINSHNPVIVYTDSKPCVQSYEKLCRGEFSTSARVATFLSIISRYPVKLLHIKGSNNVFADFASRNPLNCNNSMCQVCKFIESADNSVVRHISVQDIIQSKSAVPFSSKNTWLQLQQSCPDLRRTAAHLRQGTAPSKKENKIKYVKRYLQCAKLSKEGLLVVFKQSPLGSTLERIIVPKSYLHGLLTCLHLKLNHPSKAQLKKVFDRSFFALDAEAAISEANENCHVCLSLKNMPSTFLEQSTTIPKFIGSDFTADIVRRCSQFILIVRENITSFTAAKFVNSENAESLKEGIVILLSQLRSTTGPNIQLRVDPGSGWRSLYSSKSLESLGINLELGHEKNKNKNPIVDRGISELHAEICRIDPTGGKISEVALANAVSNLNDRIRERGLSARELWTKRDQLTGSQIPVNDENVVKRKHQERLQAHKASAKYQARGKTEPVYPNISEGDLVYIISDRDKTKPREKYIVVKPKPNSQPNTVSLQKFIGSQLRSRIYIVNSANIIKIPSDVISKELENADSDEEIETQPRAAKENDTEDEESTDEVFEEEIEYRPEPAVQGPRRSERSRRPPSRFQDYVLTPAC